MKSKITILSLLLIHLATFSQNLQLKIIGKTKEETKILDSISYTKQHNSLKQLIAEIDNTSKKLSEIGYIENQLLENKKESDTNYTATISLRSKIKYIHIYIGIKKTAGFPKIFQKNQDTITLPYSQTESFLEETTQKLEQNGYAFAKIKLKNIRKREQNIYADLFITEDKIRIINSIEIKYQNEKQNQLLPKGAKKQIDKKYSKKIFTQKNIELLHQDFEKFGFIHQLKYPEVLFTKDTTKVFVFIKKGKANNFDGFLGFNNDENKKIQFNGSLNLSLINAIRNGEELSIYWKNDGNNQKTFNANLTIPYLFKTPIGIKAQINIFKQDSTFQNTKTSLQLGYIIDYNKRFYIGHESTESSDIQNQNNQKLSDFKNSFFNASLDFIEKNPRNNLFSTKSYLHTTFGTGNRSTTTNPSENQFFINFNIMNDFYINERNIINVKNQNYYLKSKNYLTNELFRFGGTNSIRGFSENSLQTNLMIALMTEYRYLLSPKLYINSIMDYCYYEDPIISTESIKNEKLFGFGLGLGTQTNNGFLKIFVTNGTSKEEGMGFYNTNITICYNVKF